MTMNFHQLVLFTRTVCYTGPLFANNCFIFEDLNGYIIQHIHGSQGVVWQWTFTNLFISPEQYVTQVHYLLTTVSFLKIQMPLSSKIFMDQRVCMTMNIHQLVHFTRTVCYTGPMYANNCFVFEDSNGFIIQNIHGSQVVYDNEHSPTCSFHQNSTLQRSTICK